MLNSVCLMGRLGSDPELRHTQTGIAVTSFSIAVDRTYQPKGSEKQTDWINVVAWRNTAEFICRYFNKGSMLALNGAIQTRQYNDKEGNRRTAFEVVAENVFFCGSKRDGGDSFGGGFSSQVPSYGDNDSPMAFSTAGADDFEEIVGDDELPF